MANVTGKQEPVVVRLEIDGQYDYCGNLKALCDHWDKDALGVGYAYLRNYGISEEKTSGMRSALFGREFLSKARGGILES